MRATVENRFWSKVTCSDLCWEWMGAKSNGYGNIRNEHGKTELAHIWSFRKAHGLDELDSELDHLCRNRSCVRPTHLELVTHTKNMQRAALARSCCRNGHELTKENIWSYPGTEWRYCRPCKAARSRRAYLKSKGQP